MSAAPMNSRPRTARFDASQQHRRAMMGKIAVARKQLAMAEDDYRQGLFDQTGKLSLKDCSEGDMARVLDWLKSKGFRPLAPKGTAQHPMARKARALWISLYHLGAVHNRDEAALEAFARRQIGCERLVWARQSDAYKLIEALKSMADRHGWPQHSRVTQKPLGGIELKASLCQAILRRLKDAGAAPEEWHLGEAAFRLCGIDNGKERGWTAEDYAGLAAALGHKLREAGGQNG